MPSLLFGTGAYQRLYADLPELKLVNFFAEKSPVAENGVMLLARPGLTSWVERGAGPVFGVFSSPGTFAGALFTVSGNIAYKDEVPLGAVDGTMPVSWAASDTEIVFTRGKTAYSYNGTNLQPISFPDAADVLAVTYIGGLFVFVREGGHQFYWSAELDARTIDSLDFASAEMKPDDLLDVAAIDGAIYFFGQRSTEKWILNPNNAALPFTRIDLNLFSKGVIDSGCVAEVDQVLLMVGDDGSVYPVGGSGEPISHPGIQEAIAASPTCMAYSFTLGTHHLFAIRLDLQTFLYDTSEGEWYVWATYGHSNWRPRCATMIGREAYFGDDTDGVIWNFGDTFEDDDGPLEGYFTALAPIAGGTVPFDRIEVIANVGSTDPLEGDDASPVIEIRSSRDAGRTFGTWREASLGAQGKYRTRAIWRRNGRFDSPGAVFEFRITDSSPRRISGVKYNERGGGRSR